jgi:hypothetical protein
VAGVGHRQRRLALLLQQGHRHGAQGPRAARMGARGGEGVGRGGS